MPSSRSNNPQTSVKKLTRPELVEWANYLYIRFEKKKLQKEQHKRDNMATFKSGRKDNDASNH